MSPERAAELRAAYEAQRQRHRAEWWENAPEYIERRDEEAEAAEAAKFEEKSQ